MAGTRAQLVEAALAAGSGSLTAWGALAVSTGIEHRACLPKDKYIVRDALTADHVWWDNAGAMSPTQFDLLLDDALDYAIDRRLYEENLRAGADPAHAMAVTVFTETAWHALFIRNLLIVSRRRARRWRRPSSICPHLQGRPQAARHPLEDGDRARHEPQHRPHRRYGLRR